MSLSRGMQLSVISARQLKLRRPAQALSVATIGTGQRAFRHSPRGSSFNWGRFSLEITGFLYKCGV